MAKLTRKSYQRKAMVVGATAFAGVALMATGFAAWVISSSTTKPLDGNVNIGVIKAQEITINATLSTDKFSFEPKKDDTTGRVRWDKTNFESLTTTLKGDFSPASYVNKFTVELRIGTEEEINDAKAKNGKTVWETNFETAAGSTKNYITLPEDVWCKEKVFEISSLTNKAETTDTKEFNQVISFGWGTAFGGMNPSEYFDVHVDGKKVTDEKLKETMNDFYAVMTTGTAETKDSIPFRVIITADTSAA